MRVISPQLEAHFDGGLQTLGSQMFQAEVRGLTQHLSQTTGDVFSPSCRAILGDSKCKVVLALPMGKSIQVSDTFDIIAGTLDKTVRND